MASIETTLTSKSGETVRVYVDADGLICGLPPGAEAALVGTEFLRRACAERARVTRLARQNRLSTLRPILGYRVCTFGTPTRGRDLGPQDGGLFRLRAGALDAAGAMVGSGSCSNARVAVIYDLSADPDISEEGGTGWEWLSARETDES